MNAIYCRVSTDEQAKKGYSLTDQAASCRSRFLAMGITNMQEYIDDGYSGEFLDRPGLETLRNDLRNGLIENIIIYDPDRLSRNLTNQLLIADEIEKAGAQLMFVTGDYDCSPEGRLFFSMRGAISAFEKAKIRERTLRGKRAKANQGKIVLNNKPYGFNWDKENSIYTINEAEAANIRLIYDLCTQNHLGTPKITSELTQRGILNRKNKPFNYMAIYRFLTKELYCGTAYARQIETIKTGQKTRKVIKRPKEEWVPIPVPAIIDHEQWGKAQKIIKQNYMLSKRNAKRDYLLTGIARCGVCGMGLVASHMKAFSQTRYYYRCVTKSSPQYKNSEHCPNRYIPVDDLENDVWETLVDIAKNKKLIQEYIKTDDFPDHSSEIQVLLKRKEEILKKQADVMKWYRANILNSQAAEEELQLITKDLNDINTKLSNLHNAQSKIKKPLNISAKDILAATTFEQKRNILLNSGLEVHVKRINKNYEFWFEQYSS